MSLPGFGIRDSGFERLNNLSRTQPPTTSARPPACRTPDATAVTKGGGVVPCTTRLSTGAMFHADPVIALLRDLVSIDSVNPTLVPGARGEADVARRLA